MPQIIDATVVNQAYSTEGNGGRKLVMLENGWLVAVVYATTPTVGFYVYRSTNNGVTWTYVTKSETNDVSGAGHYAVAHKGNIVYVISADAKLGMSSRRVRHWVLNMENTLPDPIIASATFENSQTDMGMLSLVINEAGTELHAAWSSKNSTHPNSFNTRYAKGIINANGSVTWGSVGQVTNMNVSGYDFVNPTIVLDKDGLPMFFVQCDGFSLSGVDISTAFRGIYVIKSGLTSNNRINAPYGYSAVHHLSGSHAQSNPSAIYVPPHISGTPNGEIHVTWHGRDASLTTVDRVRYSKSTDGGITWSAMEVLFDDPTLVVTNPSVTVNRNNKLFIVYHSALSGLRYHTKNGSSWESILINSGSYVHPSTLADTNLNFSSPLFIVRTGNVSVVKFFGTWTTIEVTPKPTNLGKLTSRNLLTYNITNEEGLTSDIIERVNGVTINTRSNPVSGQEYTVTLSEEQWDSIPYGNTYKSKNLLPPIHRWARNAAANGNIFSIVDDYKIQLTTISSSSWVYECVISGLEPNKQYTLSTPTNHSNMYMLAYNGPTAQSPSLGSTHTAGNGMRTFTPTGDTITVRIHWSTGSQQVYENFQLEKGSTRTAFEPMQSKHALEITLGSETWVYPFEKRLGTDASLLDAVKGVQDTKTYVEDVKAQLIAKVGGSGSFEEIIQNIGLKKWASGSVLLSGSTLPFTNSDGQSASAFHVTVGGLSFKPSFIVITNGSQCAYFSESVLNSEVIIGTQSPPVRWRLSSPNAYVDSNGFRLPVGNISSWWQNLTWIAIE